MNRNFLGNVDSEQITKILFQMTELALSESAKLLSSLGSSTISFTVDNIGLFQANDLTADLNFEEPELLAVNHYIDGENPGQILFLTEQSSGMVFIKEVLQEKSYLMEMSEMEEEALLEVGNIIVNAVLRHYVEVLHKSVCTSIPTLKREKFSGLLDQISNEAAQNVYYMVKISVETSSISFNAFILWLGHPCGMDVAKIDIPQYSTLTGPSL